MSARFFLECEKAAANRKPALSPRLPRFAEEGAGWATKPASDSTTRYSPHSVETRRGRRFPSVSQGPRENGAGSFGAGPAPGRKKTDFFKQKTVGCRRAFQFSRIFWKSSSISLQTSTSRTRPVRLYFPRKMKGFLRCNTTDIIE